MKYQIEMEHEQVDAIILKELQLALETNIKNYTNKVRVCETRKKHRKLIKSLRRTVAYFMVHEEFEDYMSELDWPVGNDEQKYSW